MLLTGDTCGGRRTGSPSQLHFQSETPPVAKNKHQEPFHFSHITRTHAHTHSCGPVHITAVSVSYKPDGDSAAEELF